MNIAKKLNRASTMVLVGICTVAIAFALLFRGAASEGETAKTQPQRTPVIQAEPLPDVPDQAVKTHAIMRLADIHTYRPERPRFQIMKYKIQEGDTAWSIAEKYDLKMESILWGNEGMSADAGSLRVGQEINILPMDGVLHTVIKDDTWERIEYRFGVKREKIIAYAGNTFSEQPPYELTIGQQIIIPEGRQPVVWQDPGPQVVAGLGRKSPGFYAGPLAGMGTGTFIWPVTPVRITQPYWDGHPAIDIDTLTGQPVYAADSGTVIFSGMSERGYGNLVILDHGNGYWTYYAHNDVNQVADGQWVAQGQQIALSGNTGRSTGDHLDFRVRREAGAFLDPMGFLPPKP